MSLPYGADGVAWIAPERSRYVPQPMNGRPDRSEQTSAAVIITLTIACTLVSVLDLFLLA